MGQYISDKLIEDESRVPRRKHRIQLQCDFVLTIHSTHNIVVEENDSINAGYTHFLADTLIQLGIDKGESEILKGNAKTYTLSLDGLLSIVENNDTKVYFNKRRFVQIKKSDEHQGLYVYTRRNTTWTQATDNFTNKNKQHIWIQLLVFFIIQK
ncbi:unnamed protein product [Mytilus edulis]|uniref:Uncharacterized protein n=1 Tax=Mytilus edulis TaxID=6550 RepID=A0A8S3UQN4_MYTED|nr:unnamed protein product [Mytilus edulis]